jgi:aldehyde dehydrogenase (NAD+)
MAEKHEIQLKFEALRTFHDEGHMRSYESRINSLQKLKKVITEHVIDIQEALKKDFSKPAYESYLSDIGVVTDELNHAISHLKHWMKPKRVSTPLAIIPGYKTKIYPESKGVVVIFAPWNYPVNLVFIPLIGAVAAGNTVLVKPAHETPNAADITAKIIEKAFLPAHVTTILGEGKTLGPLILENFRFDHIFFTGSQSVGKYVMSMAAEKLTPVTLELGGKNPAIIDKNCNIQHTVNRLVWGKFFNAGQTCIAPDHLLIHEEVYEEVIQKLKERIRVTFGDNPAESPAFARIINQSRCEKIVSYLGQGTIISGGRYDIQQRYIEPTILKVDDINAPVMNEEIFGPVWPVATWKNKEELLVRVRRNRYPLSCYIYSDDTAMTNYVIQNIEFGSGCINDNMIQFANSAVPFGGIQTSGMGRYHGRSSFETFSHAKGVVTSLSWLEHTLKYTPYDQWKFRISKLFLQ